MADNRLILRGSTVTLLHSDLTTTTFDRSRLPRHLQAYLKPTVQGYTYEGTSPVFQIYINDKMIYYYFSVPILLSVVVNRITPSTITVLNSDGTTDTFDLRGLEQYADGVRVDYTSQGEPIFRNSNGVMYYFTRFNNETAVVLV